MRAGDVICREEGGGEMIAVPRRRSLRGRSLRAAFTHHFLDRDHAGVQHVHDLAGDGTGGRILHLLKPHAEGVVQPPCMAFELDVESQQNSSGSLWHTQ